MAGNGSVQKALSEATASELCCTNILELLIGMQDNADRVVVWDYSLPLQQHKQRKLHHRVVQTGE